MARKKESDILPLIESIYTLKQELESSAWFSDFRKTLKQFTKPKFVKEIRCLALGEVSKERNPQYQLALLLYMIEYLKPARTTAWDPYFSKKDQQVLEHLNIEVTESDPKTVPRTVPMPKAETQMEPTSEPTCTYEELVWYVPHGPYFIEPDLLKKIKTSVYIGNDLTKYRPGSTRDLDVALTFKSKAQIQPLKERKADPWMMAMVNTAFHKLNE